MLMMFSIGFGYCTLFCLCYGTGMVESSKFGPVHYIAGNSLQSCTSTCNKNNLTCNHDVLTSRHALDALSQMGIECVQNVTRADQTEPPFVVGSSDLNGVCYGFDQDHIRSTCDSTATDPMERRVCMCHGKHGLKSDVRCPPGWNELEGACLRPFYSSEPMSYYQAAGKCNQMDSYLAALTDQAMLDATVTELGIHLKKATDSTRGFIGVAKHLPTFTDGNIYPYLINLKSGSLGKTGYYMLIAVLSAPIPSAANLFMIDQGSSTLGYPYCEKQRKPFFKCDVDWHYYKDMCYHLGQSQINRNDAKTYCSVRASTLVKLFKERGLPLPTSGWGDDNKITIIDGQIKSVPETPSYIDQKFYGTPIPAGLTSGITTEASKACFIINCNLPGCKLVQDEDDCRYMARNSYTCRKEINADRKKPNVDDKGVLFEARRETRSVVSTDLMLHISMVSSMMHCQQQCIGLKKCHQVNYHQESQACELLFTSSTSQTTVANGWTNAGIVS